MASRLPICLVALSISVADAHAQHEGHQAPGVTAFAPSNPACAAAGRKALAIVEAAGPGIETASGASGTGALVDDLQRAVAAAQAELFTCRAAVPTTTMSAAPPPARETAGMDHSKMAMGTSQPTARPPTPGAKPDTMAGMDHSKMSMDKPASAAKRTTPSARAGMDHSKMTIGGAPPKTSRETPEPGDAKLPVEMAERLADPACPDNAGQATAPKAIYERKVYYFCSTTARDEFRKDPAAYLKKHPR